MKGEMNMDYAAMLPTQPPEGMTAFLHKNGYLKKEYIVYTASRQSTPDGVGKGVQCTCTACGETSISSYRATGGCSHSYRRAPFGFEHPRFKQSIYDGDSTLCPVCGAEVEAIHIGNIYSEGRMMECCYPVTIQNIDGYLCVIEYQAATILEKNGRFNLRYLPSEAAIVEKRKIVRCNGIRRYYCSYIDLGKWEQRVKYVDEIGRCNKKLIYPFEPSVLNGTYAENSKLDLYIRSCKEPLPVAYLKLWQLHKNVENLITSGAGGIVSEAIERTTSTYTRKKTRCIVKHVDEFNWKEVKPQRMMGEDISKDEYRYMMKNKFTLANVEAWKRFKGCIGIDEVKAACEFGCEYLNKVIEFGQNPSRAIRYIAKQKERYKEDASRIDARTLLDYWDMARGLGEDLKEVAYPKCLISAHDGCVSRKKWKESQELIALFEQRKEELKKFEWSDGQFEIHPAQTESEMIVEGKLLHHCVARYAKDHANGKTAIFFIRFCERPDSPYFTLELDEKAMKVLQNRGAYNCARTAEVKQFEDKWLEFAKGEMKKCQK